MNKKYRPSGRHKVLPLGRTAYRSGRLPRQQTQGIVLTRPTLDVKYEQSCDENGTPLNSISFVTPRMCDGYRARSVINALKTHDFYSLEKEWSEGETQHQTTTSSPSCLDILSAPEGTKIKIWYASLNESEIPALSNLIAKAYASTVPVGCYNPNPTKKAAIALKTFRSKFAPCKVSRRRGINLDYTASFLNGVKQRSVRTATLESLATAHR